MQQATFTSEARVVAVVDGKTDIATLLSEPNLTSADPYTVGAEGGPLTKEITALILGREDTPKGLHAVIDVRVQRLMRGMYPSIPGWHCDGVPRDNYHAQPDFTQIHPATKHYTCVLATESGLSQTQFYDGLPFDMEFTSKVPTWKQLHMYMADRRTLDTKQFGEGRIVEFGPLTPHRSTPCMARGVRLFYRLSFYHNPPVKNVINAAQQVYLLSEENGW